MKIFVVVATRPDVIKLAPVVHALRRDRRFRVQLVATSQHQDLVEPLFGLFDLRVTHDLRVMKPNQSLDHIVATVVDRLGQLIESERPDLVLVQGDTTSAFVAALAAFHGRVPVGHVEAGLRTGDVRNPFPEEANREMITTLATWQYAPTRLARTNLLREGVPARSILVTGNTVVDALQFVLRRATPLGQPALRALGSGSRRLIVVTTHRRESHGAPLRRICMAVRHLAERHPDVDWLVPLHPNPNVGSKVRAYLHGLPTIWMVDPLEYGDFANMLKRCFFAMSDSGGVQEEAPALGKPVLILREKTERMEAVTAGAALLVGTTTRNIVRAAERLLEDGRLYRRMARARAIFGDGHAAERIAKHIREHYT